MKLAKIAWIVAVVLFVGFCAIAPQVARAQVVNQGSPGAAPWLTIDGPCNLPVESVVLFDGGGAAVSPPIGATGRRFIILCNSSKNAGTANWTCRVDGSDPTTSVASPGQVLAEGDCVRYYVGKTLPDAGLAPRCIADTNNSSLLITECR